MHTKKSPVKVQIDDDVMARLNASADRFGLTANAVIAAAAYELSRVPPANLWHALGRICEGEAPPTLAAPQRPAIQGRRPRIERPAAIVG
jgi:hypothetical protein